MNDSGSSDIQLEEVITDNDKISSKPSKKHFFLAGLLLCFFIVLGFAIDKFGDNSTKELKPAQATNLHKDLNESSVQSFPDLSPSNQELLGSLPEAISKLDDLDDRLGAISNRIEALNSTVSNFISEADSTFLNHNQSIDQLNRADLDIKSAISTVNVRLGDVKKSFDNFRRKAKRKSSKAALPKHPVKPPFKLVSVQIWNGSPLAVIFYRSSNMAVNADDVIAGWLIVSVTAEPDCITVNKLGVNKAEEQLLCM